VIITDKVYIQVCNIYIGDKKMNAKIENMENKMGNEKIENRKFVVRIFSIYPVWGMGQLSGAIVCDSEDEAYEIAKENRGPHINTTVEEMTGDIESELWKEWAEDVELLLRNGHDEIDGLNIITADEYRKDGFEFVKPDYEDAVFSEEGDFLGWYDADKDAVVDSEGNVIGRYDDKGNFVRED